MTFAIGSASTALRDNIETTIQGKYTTSQITVDKDTASATTVNFDKNFLFPLKSSVNFFLGGVNYIGSSAVGGDTVYEYTVITNTKIPTSYFYLMSLSAETYINQLTGKSISITVINAPMPRTFDQL